MRKILPIALSLLLIVCSLPYASALGFFIPVKGDANGDGTVTSYDARLILRTAVGIDDPVFLRKHLYDMDADGMITSDDARNALRTAVGLEPIIEDKEKSREQIIKDFTSTVSENELKSLMIDICAIGSRSIYFPAKNLAAQEYISKKLREYGVYFKKQTFYYGGIETANIVSTLQQGPDGGDILLLCTHYDCYDGSSGAIDNASGVAALLYTIKLIKENKITFKGEIRIAFLSAEEMGYHGAYRYTSALTADEISRMSVFNIDMAGNSLLGGGKLLVVSTEPVSGSAYSWRQAKSNTVSLAIDEGKKLLGNLGEEKYYSPVSAGRHDIVAFRRAGIPSVTLSWREIRSAAAYGSDYNLAPPSQIHTGSDTLANFSIPSLCNTTKLIVASLLLGFAE